MRRLLHFLFGCLPPYKQKILHEYLNGRKMRQCKCGLVHYTSNETSNSNK